MQAGTQEHFFRINDQAKNVDENKVMKNRRSLRRNKKKKFENR